MPPRLRITLLPHFWGTDVSSHEREAGLYHLLGAVTLLLTNRLEPHGIYLAHPV
jgi:hypothetical protein